MKPPLISLQCYISPLLLQRLTPENSEKIYELEDVVKSFDDLQKATRFALQFLVFFLPFFGLDVALSIGVDTRGAFTGRILENHQREQRERSESEAEGLKLKVEHLQKESGQLQNLFQEKSNINESIRQEVSRLSSENSVSFWQVKSSLRGVLIGKEIFTFHFPSPM